MGIYSNGTIYGLRIYNVLNNKNDISFMIYTESSNILNPSNKETFMTWFPITLKMFLEHFAFEI